MLKEPRVLDNLKSWIGKTETVVDEVTTSSVRRIRAMLDYEPATVRAGDVLPTGWHATVCAPLARQSELGEDGHPKRGSFIPPVPFARRMAGSAQMTFHADLLVGDTVTRKSLIENVVAKKGRSGDIVFVTQKNDFYTVRGLAVTERHELAFREVTRGRETSPPGEKVDTRPAWQMTIVVDPVMVFRYAAVAFSGHRIHYDYQYGTKTENYADVMGSGGLNVMLLFDLVQRNLPCRIVNFASRNIRPIFVNERVHVCGTYGSDKTHLKLWITNDEGVLAVVANAELA